MNTNEVRQVMMNELGLTREFIKQEATKLIEQTITQHMKNLDAQGTIKDIVESEFRRIAEGNHYTQPEILEMCRTAIKEQVAKHIDGNLRFAFVFRGPG